VSTSRRRPAKEKGAPQGATEASGGASPFSESELAAAAAPVGEPELEEIEPAEIEDRSAEPEVPFEKLVHKGRRLPPERIRAIVQSLLFVADKPLAAEQLHECTGIDRPALQQAIEELAAIHREGAGGIVLAEVAGGWQLRTDPSSAEYVRRFLRVKPQRLTRAAVETLAIIAYRQPVTRPEIEDVRGVDSGAVVKALLERKLVKILGRKEEVGRPILYGTTREFLEFFALRDLASLPTLREFQELSQEHQELVEKELSPSPLPVDLIDPGARSAERPNPQSDAALAELEAAIATADQRSRAASSLLSVAAPAAEPGDDVAKTS
jgi:segregation and condensation protein B